MDEYSAYQSAERAELYDAVYADVGDVEFWEAIAPPASEGPVLELGSGTGRLLLPLARAGHEVVGIDAAPHMIARCRTKLQAEPADVRARVSLLEADMTSFQLDRRFALVFCAFGSFHHLSTVEQQLACLERCREHLLPGGRLVLDLINPDPEPEGASAEDVRAEGDAAAADKPLAVVDSAVEGVPASEGYAGAGTVDWTEGRRIRSWATVVGRNRALQVNDCEVTYEIIEANGAERRVIERFPMRFVFRYELEHLLARSGFGVVALYGDYDRSAFCDGSLGMIVVAEV
jgi:SAM-dependent methyltransferase